MSGKTTPRCAWCETRTCHGGTDCFDNAERDRLLYEDQQIARLHQAATAIESRHYCKEPRIREILLFAKEMGYRKLGLAFCVGMAEEARVIADILAREFEVVSICCKHSGIEKKDLNLERLDPDRDYEAMCNPAGQAMLLNEAGTDLNILCGLCVGHDAIFNRVSQAPVTTLIVKDRVLGHNPVAAVYSRYIRRRLLPD